VEEASWNRGRIGVIGQGRSGKTTLVYAMSGLPTKETKSTVGIVKSVVAVRDVSINSTGWASADAQQGSDSLFEAHVAKHILSARANQDSNVVQPVLSTVGANQATASREVDSSGGGNSKSGSLGKEPGEGSVSVTAGAVYEMKAAEKAPPGAAKKAAVVLEKKAVTAVSYEEVMKVLGTLTLASSELVLTLVDYGGQSVFTPLHHLAIIEDAVYLVTFNMQLLVGGRTEAETLETLAVLRSWVDTVDIAYKVVIANYCYN